MLVMADTEEKPESKTVTLWIRNNAAVENDAGRTPRSGLYSMAAASFQNDLGVSFNTDAEGRRSKPHVAGREAPLSRKRKASHPSPSPGPVEHKRSRHDGKVVVPFPLEPEDFNDLDLLKSAAKDMTVHLQVVKTRIKDIEDQKRSEEKKINPWDLV